MQDHNTHKYKSIFRGFFHQLLTIDFVRYCVARICFFYFVRICRKLKTFDLSTQKAISSNTVFHNLKGLKDLAVVRSLALIKSVTAIYKVGINSKVLTIGPRTVGEAVDYVYFSHSIDADRQDLKGSVIAVFSTKK